jgi:Flp pilus assembly secretin CpaC
VTSDAKEPPRPLVAAADPVSKVVLPPLSAPPPNMLDTLPLEPGPASKASAVLAINPLTPPSAATRQPCPDLPGPGGPAPLGGPVPAAQRPADEQSANAAPWRIAEPVAGANLNVGPFEVVDNSNELVVVLDHSKHLRTKVDVAGAEAADRSVCEVEMPTARELTITGRSPGVTRVAVQLEGDRPHSVALLVRVVPDVAVEKGPEPAQSRPPAAVGQVALRVMVGELDRTAAKTAGVDSDFTSAPATMLLRSLPSAAYGNAAILENRLTVRLGTRGLQEHGVLKIFSEPTLVVASGRTANVVVSSEPPGGVPPGPGGSRPAAKEIALPPTTLSLLATLTAQDRIRLEVTAERKPREAGAGLVQAGLSRPPTASTELRDGQTMAVCGLIEAPKRPPPESPSTFPIFGQWFSKPAPPPPNPTEMLILVTADRLHPSDAAPAGSPPVAGDGRK